MSRPTTFAEQGKKVIIEQHIELNADDARRDREEQMRRSAKKTPEQQAAYDRRQVCRLKQRAYIQNRMREQGFMQTGESTSTSAPPA